MAELLPCVEVGPAGSVDGAVVWLHGLGASGHDFEDIVPMLRLPRVRFVFPHAPPRGVTINGGIIMPAWYDILRFSDAAGSERADQVRESAEMVEALLARECSRGVPSGRSVLAGFSQGGAMALYTGLRHDQALAGIMVLSGYEVLSSERQVHAANAATPMFFGHGTYDPVVPVSRGRAAQKACAEGRDTEWHEYPMGHEVRVEEIAHIRDWLHARLATAPPE
jgi:phospholipase/carboxylesterase